MRIDRPPDRLGRPPNYRWIMRDPPDPPPKKVFDRIVFQSLKRLEHLSLTVIEVYRDQ